MGRSELTRSGIITRFVKQNTFSFFLQKYISLSDRKISSKSAHIRFSSRGGSTFELLEPSASDQHCINRPERSFAGPAA
eukprot:scaffold2638_cov114-Cylindrotheca_fusiformis.AAC.11